MSNSELDFYVIGLKEEAPRNPEFNQYLCVRVHVCGKGDSTDAQRHESGQLARKGRLSE
jgi:hypothetical protein